MKGLAPQFPLDCSRRSLSDLALCPVPPFSPPVRRRKPLLSGEDLGKGRAEYGRLRPILEPGFRRSDRAAPIWPANGAQRPERPQKTGGDGGGPGKAKTAALGGHTAEFQGARRAARAWRAGSVR